jgi:hypothetical protein
VREGSTLHDILVAGTNDDVSERINFESFLWVFLVLIRALEHCGWHMWPSQWHFSSRRGCVVKQV